MFTAMTLRDRLLLAVSVAAMACGSSDSSSTSSVANDGAGGASGAGGAAGAGANAGAAGSGAGPTATCHSGAPCHGDEWCGYATGEAMTTPCGGCGIPADHCVCDGTSLVCGKDPGFSAPVTVCIPGAGACPPEGITSLQSALAGRFGPGCPSLGQVMGEGTATTQSDGTAVCCYSAPLLGCLGRPFAIGSSLRAAALLARAGWA